MGVVSNKHCLLTFFILLNKMLVIRAGFLKMLVRIANREDLDQKQSDLGLCCLSVPFWKATSVGNFRTFNIPYWTS